MVVQFSQSEELARRKYRQFVLDGIPLGRQEELTGGGLRENEENQRGKPLKRLSQKILGSKAFVEKLIAEEERKLRQQILLTRKRISLEEFTDFICEKFGVTREEMTGGSQKREVNLARSVLCFLASRDLGLTGRGLSRGLGLTPAAIHYAVLRGEKFLAENQEMKSSLYKHLTNLTTSP